MRHVNIILTTYCNWNCSYCNITDYGEHWITKDKIDKHISYIKSMMGDYELVLSGGEIGYMQPEILSYFLFSIGKMVTINTNGMFMKRGLHKDPKIRKYIKRILYHVIDEPSDKTVEIIEDDELDISYGIVGYDINNIRDFVKRNKHINFDYIAIETPFKDVYVDYVTLLWEIKDFGNITQTCMNRLESYNLKHNHIDRYRKICKKTNFSIDISSEEICLCAFKNKHINIELTEENLKRVLIGYQIKGQDFCDFCDRVCMDVNIETISRDLINKKRIYET